MIPSTNFWSDDTVEILSIDSTDISVDVRTAPNNIPPGPRDVELPNQQNLSCCFSACQGLRLRSEVNPTARAAAMDLDQNERHTGNSTEFSGFVRLPAELESSEQVNRNRVYVTRYNIDHNEQTKNQTRAILHSDCVPCCDRSNGNYFLSFIRGEAFLFTVHFLVIVIGGVTINLELRDQTSIIGIVITVIEISLTIIVIAIRMENSYLGYIKVIEALRLVKYHVPGNDDVRASVQAEHMKAWMIAFMCGGVFLIIVAIVCFLVLFYYNYLDWTFLSNNFCLITIAVFSGLYQARVNLAVIGIREDQLKIVLWEATLAIKDACSKNAMDNESRKRNVQRFVKALDATKVYECPKYVRQRNTNYTKT